MSSTTDGRPWEELRRRLAGGGAAEAVTELLDALPAGEAARTMSRLGGDEQRRVFELLEPADAAQLVEQMADVQAAEMLDDLAPGVAAAIVHELDSDDQTDLLASLAADDVEAILAELPPEEAASVRILADYPAEVAGGLMMTEYLAYHHDATVAEVADDLRRNAEVYADYAVQYVYAVDRGGRLRGVVPLRDLLLGKPRSRLGEIMIASPVSVLDGCGLAELEDLFDRQGFVAVPVVDSADRLLGVVRRSAVEEALAERADSDYRKSLGIVGGEELRTMPLLKRSSRRLSWLSVNILLNVLAASVIAYHQDTLAAVIALAAFLPIISDMSGCSGNQAVAVSMRELSLGLVRPSELLRVWLQEAGLGLLNGTVLGLLLGAVAWLWKGNLYLGLVVGGALAVNTVVAVSIGGTVPLVLRRLGFDPALASGPILTTITDLCGFLLTLQLASVMLPQLTV
jgi:magnesium transporter